MMKDLGGFEIAMVCACLRILCYKGIDGKRHPRVMLARWNGSIHITDVLH